jgi:hypothetical protein
VSFEAELELMHAAADAAFGVTATFRPKGGGPAVTGVLVERFRPEPEIGLDHAQAVVPDELLRVMKSALPARPARGDVFEIGAEKLRVIATPTVEDDDGLRWTVKVESVS